VAKSLGLKSFGLKSFGLMTTRQTAKGGRKKKRSARNSNAASGSRSK
jgi:hypothetical protein